MVYLTVLMVEGTLHIVDSSVGCDCQCSSGDPSSVRIHTHATTFEDAQPFLGGFLLGLVLDEIFQRVSILYSRGIGLEAIIHDPLRLAQTVAKYSI
jgi:hypothetical protein